MNTTLAEIALFTIAGVIAVWLWAWPDIRRRQRAAKAAEYKGATEDWSPTGTYRQVTQANLTPTEILPSHVVRPEVRVPDTDALADDVRRAFDEALAPTNVYSRRVDLQIARFTGQLNETEYRREVQADDTQAIPIQQWNELDTKALPAGSKA